MSQGRMMLSMKRRKLLWWGRILLLIAIAFPVFSLLVAIIIGGSFGIMAIPLWLEFLNGFVIIFLVMFCPTFYLIAHHPFEEMKSGITKVTSVLVKVAYVFLLFIWCIFLAIGTDLNLLIVSDFCNSLILQIDSQIILLLSYLGETSGFQTLASNERNAYLDLTKLVVFVIVCATYELSGWKMLNHWSLKFPPEEYPPFNKQEKAQMGNGGAGHASSGEVAL